MRIDFHVNVEHRIHYACRVVRKACAAGMTVLAYTRAADRLARFDSALWTFSALDFLPHVYADSPLAAGTPIVLTLDAGAPLRRELLLNLDDEAPPRFAEWFPSFDRVIEVVSADETELAQARQRFRQYRDAGFAPARHEQAAEQ